MQKHLILGHGTRTLGYKVIRSQLFEAPLTSLSATACPPRHQHTPAASSTLLQLPAHPCSASLHFRIPFPNKRPLSSFYPPFANKDTISIVYNRPSVQYDDSQSEGILGDSQSEDDEATANQKTTRRQPIRRRRGDSQSEDDEATANQKTTRRQPIRRRRGDSQSEGLLPILIL
ncbi:unnamed protein product [Acanthosepion pharaonis]|uniref:Uncharacterized protein n=1 Tax=Acanthosepion pharaonis TaxID=158019 RepID=A0A812C8U4_ACAPH|nr:unnamed protein product [Sepia pharaonis]